MSQSPLSPQPPQDPKIALLAQFLASLVHDMRTSFSVIRFSLHDLRAVAKTTPAVSEPADMIDRELKDLNLKLSRLMEITNLTYLDPAQYSLLEMADQAVSRLDRERKGPWKWDASVKEASLWCDRERMEQVLFHLLKNALTACKGQGPILLRYESDGTYDTVEVKDTGPGVAPEVRNTLFEPFVTTKRPGMGLGLTYARKIVEAHGGSVDLVDSTANGSTFRVRLPKKEHAPSLSPDD